MNQLRFHVRDTWEPNIRVSTALIEAFRKAGLVDTDDLSECEILVLHRNTDAPGKTKGIEASIVESLLARGGIYVEYTTSRTPWEHSDQKGIYGSSFELLRRIRKIKPGLSLNKIKEILEASPPDKPMNLTALVIQCQGYLATYAAWMEINKKEIGKVVKESLVKMGWEEFLNHSENRHALVNYYASKHSDVLRASWWTKIFAISCNENQKPDDENFEKFLEIVEEEFNVNNRASMPEGVIKLLNTLRDGKVDNAEIVALAYCDIVAGLRR